MIDLEEEFHKLVTGMYQQVQSLENDGAISSVEAEDLRKMILARTQTQESSWERSNDYYDEGWAPSANC